MWINCLGGKYVGKYKILGYILLYFKVNYIYNIINLIYCWLMCKICVIFKCLLGL